MNNDNKVETATAGLNYWATYATVYKCQFEAIRAVKLIQQIAGNLNFKGQNLFF